MIWATIFVIAYMGAKIRFSLGNGFSYVARSSSQIELRYNNFSIYVRIRIVKDL